MTSFVESFGDSLMTKSGSASTTEALGSAKLVAIYFSAHWCPPCRGFTPVLAEFYQDCKEKGIEIEVVFVSSDRDQASFDEYYGSMPWKALPFSESTKKQALSSKYGVRGIPTLIVLNSNGEVVDAEGRGTVMGNKTDVEGAAKAWGLK